MKNEDEEEVIAGMLDEAYGSIGKVDPKKPVARTGQQIPIVIDRESGEVILPEIREIRCPCKRKVKIFLIQKVMPVWAGVCPRCKSYHWRGETETISNLTKKERHDLIKKAKKMAKRSRRH